MKRKATYALVVAVWLILALSVTAAAAPPTPQATSAFDKIVASQVDVSRMLENMKVLTMDIGPRVATSPEEKAAAEYIKGTFQKYGYDAQFQPVPVENNVAYLKMLAPKEQNVWVRIGSYPPPSVVPLGSVTGKVIDCGLGNSPADFPSAVAGNIALVKRGETAPGSGVGEATSVVTQKIKNAQAAGAVGVLIQNFEWRIFTATTGGDASITVPFATMNNEAGALLMQPGVEATLYIGRYSGSVNVIASKKPKNKNIDTGKVIVVGGHYDSVPTAPGANDDASGTVVTMELARIFAGLPVDTEVRFITWCAEELGLVGSRYYVNQLTADEKALHLGNFNMDMIANNDPKGGKLWTLTYMADPTDPTGAKANLVTETVAATAWRMGLTQSGVFMGRWYRGGSDHVPFNEAGIAGANISFREFHNILEPWYHHPWDNMQVNINPERLKIGAQVVGSSVYEVARPDTPNLEMSAVR